jgi:hypothetical protein
LLFATGEGLGSIFSGQTITKSMFPNPFNWDKAVGIGLDTKMIYHFIDGAISSLHHYSAPIILEL